MKSIVASFRIKPEELAKALEGLSSHGVVLENLNTISSIVRTTFYYGIVSLCENPDDPASEETLKTVMQLIKRNKKSSKIELKDILP